MQIPVAELIVRFMERLGIRRIFGLPGSHILPVYDALRTLSIRTVLAKHEQAAAFMAMGHARATGGIGACITTAGPGATNLVTAIASAYADRLPILAITGEAPTHIFGRGGLQESSGEGGSVDQVALFAGITRYHRLVERTDYLANVLIQAAKCLLSDTPGPVVLSLPFNVQKESVEATLLDEIAFFRAARACPATPEDVRRSVALLARSRRPMIVAGHGVIRARACATLTRLAQRLHIPVATSLKAKGAMDERSPWALGSLGVTSAGHALRYLKEEADLVLVLGASFNERTSYVWDRGLLAGKTLIQVDNDTQQLEKVFRADLAIHADLAAYLEALDHATHHLPPRETVDVPAFIAANERRLNASGEAVFDARFEHVRAFFVWLEQKFPQGLVLFDDNIVFAQSFYRVSGKDHFHPNTGISSLGHAIPAAIGAGFALNKPLFALIGDGGFHMCAMELMTAVHYGIPLNVVLFSNGTMGLIRKNQQHLYGGRFIDCDFPNPDFALLARAFGIRHSKLASADDLAHLDELDFQGGINLIEIPVARDAYPNYASRR
ncbi:thiamine pyrophosphate-binding protein [Thiobacter aerophilum]|uniref:Thiamine pyrophosphate-binding protein n=1 Tax=Thiobacter aerophilum TaxID=3121275 RepID=A0ABV0EET1_9BURK